MFLSDVFVSFPYLLIFLVREEENNARKRRGMGRAAHTLFLFSSSCFGNVTFRLGFREYVPELKIVLQTFMFNYIAVTTLLDLGKSLILNACNCLCRYCVLEALLCSKLRLAIV
jgi:hypothetical protein